MFAKNIIGLAVFTFCMFTFAVKRPEYSAYSDAPKKSDNRCVEELLGIPAKLAKQIAETNRQRATMFMKSLAGTSDFMDTAIRLLKKHTGFKKFISTHSIDFERISEVNKWSVVTYFVEMKLRGYEGNALDTLQELSLSLELSHRGHLIKESAGVKNEFKKISKLNLIRWIEKVKTFGLYYREINDQGQLIIDEIVQDIDFNFIHNTTESTKFLYTNLLSSEQIKAIGVYPTANNAYFNSEYLKSSNNVFFHFVIYRKSHGMPLIKTEYGDVNWVLNREYALESAFVSPFVMYPRELIAFAKVNSPNIFKKLQLEVVRKSRDFNIGLPNENYRFDDDGWSKALTDQSAYDLTLKDAEFFSRTLLVFQLQKLFVEDRRAFEEVVAKLNNPENSQNVLSEITYKGLGLNEGLELKVPISVPLNKINKRYAR